MVSGSPTIRNPLTWQHLKRQTRTMRNGSDRPKRSKACRKVSEQVAHHNSPQHHNPGFYRPFCRIVHDNTTFSESRDSSRCSRREWLLYSQRLINFSLSVSAFVDCSIATRHSYVTVAKKCSIWQQALTPLYLPPIQQTIYGCVCQPIRILELARESDSVCRAMSRLNLSLATFVER
jgi:hypothetical protein